MKQLPFSNKQAVQMKRGLTELDGEKESYTDTIGSPYQNPSSFKASL